MSEPTGPAPDADRPGPSRSEPTGEEFDARFAEIVAGWDSTAPSSGSSSRRDRSPALWPEPDPPSTPTSPGLGPPPPAVPDPRGAASVWPAEGMPGAPVPAAAWRGHVPPEEDEHFVPPEPAALPPAHDATYWLALAGLTLGPLVVLWAAMFSGNPDPGWWVLLGVAATVVGFGLLVLRGSGERDPDDDGAQV